jgi:hypothetical protein
MSDVVPVHLEHGVFVDGKYVCDGCNVFGVHEHRCHGRDAGESVKVFTHEREAPFDVVLCCTCADPGCRVQRGEVTVAELRISAANILAVPES